MAGRESTFASSSKSGTLMSISKAAASNAAHTFAATPAGRITALSRMFVSMTARIDFRPGLLACFGDVPLDLFIGNLGRHPTAEFCQRCIHLLPPDYIVRLRSEELLEVGRIDAPDPAELHAP